MASLKKPEFWITSSRLLLKYTHRYAIGHINQLCNVGIIRRTQIKFRNKSWDHAIANIISVELHYTNPNSKSNTPVAPEHAPLNHLLIPRVSIRSIDFYRLESCKSHIVINPIISPSLRSSFWLNRVLSRSRSVAWQGKAIQEAKGHASRMAEIL